MLNLIFVQTCPKFHQKIALTIQVWNFATGELVKNFDCHDGAVLSCDVSPDGSKVVSASADKSAKVGVYFPKIRFYLPL